MNTEEMVKILEEILKLMEEGSYVEAKAYLEILTDLLKKEGNLRKTGYEAEA